MKVTKSALISARKCTKSVLGPGSARAHWGAYSDQSDPLAGFKG